MDLKLVNAVSTRVHEWKDHVANHMNSNGLQTHTVRGGGLGACVPHAEMFTS